MSLLGGYICVCGVVMSVSVFGVIFCCVEWLWMMLYVLLLVLWCENDVIEYVEEWFVGFEFYVNVVVGFDGVLKECYSDFIVWEIDIESGEVVVLNELSVMCDVEIDVWEWKKFEVMKVKV